MMRMLLAGGMEVLTDEVRKADEDNPRGYFEYEPVKKTKEDASWLDNCRGKAVKMVSMLLYDLPSDTRYKIIFMRRDMGEMLASQNAMLNRLEKEGADVGDKEMAQKFEKHLRHLEDWIRKQKNIEAIDIHYNQVIEDPLRHAKMVSQFLGGWMNVQEMAKVVEKSLYRRRRAAE